MLSALVDLILPGRCAGCGVACGAKAPLCGPCAALLTRPPRHVPPDPAPPGLPPPWAVGAYEGAVRRVIVAYKERGRWSLSVVLGRSLAAAVRAAWTEVTPRGAAFVPSPVPADAAELLLVPVPARTAAVRRRGYDPVRRLADAAAATLRGSGLRAFVLPLLTHARSVADQADLGSARRAANLSGAFIVPPGQARRARGRSVIIVDDVVTTGATLTEAARALRAAGAVVPCAGTVAATRRRGTGLKRCASPLHSAAFSG